MKTLGISPKVIAPAILNLIVGGVLVLLGERELGIGCLLAVVTGTGAGIAARPGITVTPPAPTLG